MANNSFKPWRGRDRQHRGSRGNARAQINFGRAGMKVLDLSVAKLERVGR
jgi:hypothetical protein